MVAVSRRTALKTGIAASLAGLYLPRWSGSSAANVGTREKLPVAGVITVYHQNSHADVILGKILEGFQQDGGVGPDLKLVSLYVDQKPGSDLSKGLIEKYGIRSSATIDDALTLGTNEIQVRGVLSIGEHGDYPATPDTAQVMYPRRRFFDEIVATFRRCGRSVPVFNDKHLSWRFDDALHMVTTARKMHFPLLAGSSVPVAWRYPAIELPADCEIESALTIGYGGFEAYGFHAIEGHQCMIERRRGGETGVASVQVVRGDKVTAAETDGRWSTSLLDAALRTLPDGQRDRGDWKPGDNSAGYLFRHRDGLNSAVLMANGLTGQFATAVRLKGEREPLATWFRLQESAPFGHFAYLLHAIEETIHSGRAVYPVERTLLSTGMLDRVMQSIARGGSKIDTPELDVAYQAAEWPFANHPKSFMMLPNE